MPYIRTNIKLSVAKYKTCIQANGFANQIKTSL
uniref:Uncharacterized protein n=1 Tax=Rhizophora mucronata TaxID=61149 RepID=A0A2P2P344_RHIMU